VTFYEEMREVADDLLGEFKQGVCGLKRKTGSTPGENEWDPPTDVYTTYSLAAVVKRMHHRYENGALIAETGDMVTFAVPDEVVPVLTDKLVIDGVERAITELTPIPAAGTPVAYKAWCAA
jgi:hypothetical protein